MRARPARGRRRPSRPFGADLRHRPFVLALTVAALVWWGAVSACGASNWMATVASGSKGESQATSLPAAPGSVGAVCAAPTTAKTITVTWSAVSLATSYSVYDSTTSATAGFAVLATGVTGTSWTSAALTSGKNYWFKMTALVGSNWASAQSAASPESTINSANPFCKQP